MWNVYSISGGLIAKDFRSKPAALAWAKAHCKCNYFVAK